MENNRAQWGSKIGFILAAAGSAVGLGNIWKFPGKAFEGGGGAYILIYLAIVVLIGFPVMLSELTIGRAAQANAIDSFHKLGYRGFKWDGVTGVAVAFIVTSYYCHVGGWVLRYVVSYITEAQTVYADPLGYFYGLLGYNAATGETWFPLTAILFAAVFMAVNAVIIIKGVEGGIEKFNKVGMPALFVILIVLLARTITLDGAQVGFAYMLSCDWSKVGFNTFLSALGQAFFSLSLGMAIMITYGSYLPKHENLGKNTALICTMDTLVALIAGFIIVPAVFATLGSENVGKGGGFAFASLAGVFEHMAGGAFFGVLFYMLLLFAALTSSIALTESAVSTLQDELHWSRKKATSIMGVSMVLLGSLSSLGYGPLANVTVIGMQFLDFFDFLTNSVMMPIAAIASCILVSRVIGVDRIADEVTLNGAPFRRRKVFNAMIRFLCPFFAAIILISSIASAFGWISM
mgnify:CR=1 FL=1